MHTLDRSTTYSRSMLKPKICEVCELNKQKTLHWTRRGIAQSRGSISWRYCCGKKKRDFCLMGKLLYNKRKVSVYHVRAKPERTLADRPPPPGGKRARPEAEWPFPEGPQNPMASVILARAAHLPKAGSSH